MKVKVKKEIDYDKIRCLVLAAYYLGQETGLNHKMFEHQDAVSHRKTLVDLILSTPLRD